MPVCDKSKDVLLIKVRASWILQFVCVCVLQKPWFFSSAKVCVWPLTQASTPLGFLEFTRFKSAIRLWRWAIFCGGCSPVLGWCLQAPMSLPDMAWPKGTSEPNELVCGGLIRSMSQRFPTLEPKPSNTFFWNYGPACQCGLISWSASM